jgi:hypothetical protein
MNNPVKFKYQLTDPGSAVCILEINDHPVEFRISNAGNPLSDLLRGMVSLIFEPSHIWEEENIQLIDWYGIETSYKWIFSTDDGENVNIKIIEYSDLFDSSTGVTKLNEVCLSYDFYLGIISELDKFIKKTGLLNYEQQWQKDEFPLTYFLILKKYLVEKGLWNSETNGQDILNNEMDILFL